jgi:hypothetical protein
LWLAFVASLIGATYIGFNPPSGEPIGVIDAIWASSFVGFPTAGALVISRIPRRPLGWLLCVAPLLLMFGVFCSELARVGPQEDSAALGEWIYWLGTVTFNAGMGLLLLTLLFLPNGLLLSRRWRLVVWPVVVATALAVVAAAVGPWTIEGGGGNPIGIASLSWFFDLSEALLGVTTVWALGFGVLSLILRFRGSTGMERQQLKVLALGGGGVAASFGALVLVEAVLGDQSDFVATVFVIAAILSLPTSIAMAVMRHRLYDVDVVINRTLVYGTLTAILALVYLGIVVVLQRLLEPITNQSDVAVAASTLAVAALARPARSGIQEFIDRRFYRRKYDAAETLGDFSIRLRDQVDLDSLTHDLVGVVGSTMQPAHASVWLRDGAAR